MIHWASFGRDACEPRRPLQGMLTEPTSSVPAHVGWTAPGGGGLHYSTVISVIDNKAEAGLVARPYRGNGVSSVLRDVSALAFICNTYLAQRSLAT
jgi:hypothetical protein